MFDYPATSFAILQEILLPPANVISRICKCLEFLAAGLRTWIPVKYAQEMAVASSEDRQGLCGELQQIDGPVVVPIHDHQTAFCFCSSHGGVKNGFQFLEF